MRVMRSGSFVPVFSLKTMLPSSAIYKHQRWGSAWGTQLDRTHHHNLGRVGKRQTLETLLKKFYFFKNIHSFNSLQKLHILYWLGSKDIRLKWSRLPFSHHRKCYKLHMIVSITWSDSCVLFSCSSKRPFFSTVIWALQNEWNEMKYKENTSDMFKSKNHINITATYTYFICSLFYYACLPPLTLNA